LKNKNAYNFYITTDFATAAEDSNDYSVISVWAINSNGDWFWVDGVVEKQLMDANVNDLFRLAQKYKPQKVGIEVSGQQGGFVTWVEQEMMRRNVWFALASENNKNKAGIRPVPNQRKIDRFQVVVPWFKMGKMYFPVEMKDEPEMQQAMDELSLVSRQGFKSKHDDFSDTISMLSVMDAWRPSDTPTFSEGDGGIWDDDDDDDDINSVMSSYVV
jgi:predicted phage terminase large subunit-like protein